MSKTKNKDHSSETQFLKAKVRNLEKQVRQLLKQLKYHAKKDHLYEDIKDQIQEVIHAHDNEETFTEENIKINCDRCNEGHFEELKELMPNKWYSQCNHCGYSKRLK